MYRKPMNKGRSAKRFNNSTTRTKAINMANAPMRGGIRL